VGITEYVSEHLYWLPLRSDEDLVEHLEDHLLTRAHAEQLKATRSLRVMDLVNGPLFSRFDARTKERLLTRLEESRHQRRYRGGKQEAELGQVSLLDSLFSRGNNHKRLTKA